LHVDSQVWVIHVCLGHTCMFGSYMYVRVIHAMLGHTCMFGAYMYIWVMPVCLGHTCMLVCRVFTGLNRHHSSLFIHNCHLVLLLRQEPLEQKDAEILKPAEWRWMLPEVCDGKWHQYTINVNLPRVGPLLYPPTSHPNTKRHPPQ